MPLSTIFQLYRGRKNNEFTVLGKEHVYAYNDHTIIGHGTNPIRKT
jgi:hypothetical protein